MRVVKRHGEETGAARGCRGACQGRGGSGGEESGEGICSWQGIREEERERRGSRQRARGGP